MTPIFDIHTEETIHGIYEVEAKSAEEAQRLFEDQPRMTGEQRLYEAFDIEVKRVEKT